MNNDIGSTHWEDCWKAHEGCCDIIVRSAWSQYLSDGTQASLERYNKYKQYQTETFSPRQ